MKHKIFLLLFFILFSVFSPLGSGTARAISRTEKEQLLQQKEIFNQEATLLLSLASNAKSQKAISAQSYLAVNLSNNSILLQKNLNQAYPIASITKLITAVITLENIGTDQKITLTKEMLKPLGQSPSLFAGLNIGVENLLKASLIQSANDAAEALTFFPGKEKFIDLMNAKAKELGMEDTFFSDAYGLSPASRSTASDLAKLLAYIYKNHREILDITKDNNFWLPDKTGRLLKFQNINNFYPLFDFIGGKTGYSLEAKQTLAAIFNVNGQTIAIILLSSKNRQADTFSILKQLGKGI